MRREQLENLKNEDLLKIQERAQMYIDILGCSDAEKSTLEDLESKFMTAGNAFDCHERYIDWLLALTIVATARLMSWVKNQMFGDPYKFLNTTVFLKEENKEN